MTLQFRLMDFHKAQPTQHVWKVWYQELTISSKGGICAWAHLLKAVALSFLPLVPEAKAQHIISI